MSQQESIKLFESQKVRTFWDNEQEEWFFCINDVVAILTDSVNPADYFKKLRKRDFELDAFVRGTNCPPPPIPFNRWQITCSKMSHHQGHVAPNLAGKIGAKVMSIAEPSTRTPSWV